MEAFVRMTAVAAPLVRANIDTDIIIPSREMKSVSKTGLKDGLFAGWRYTAVGGRDPKPDFVLNQPEYAGAGILLAGENVGCGSSREHAVWALHEYGFRAVIAPSFNPIFYNNCVRNGLCPVILPAETVAAIAAQVEADPAHAKVTVDLEAQKVTAPDGSEYGFTLNNEEDRIALLNGYDAVDLTLLHKEAIDAFIAGDQGQRPWVYLAG
ncbi:3-isopropylmalate dehydratase [Brevundimonas sp. GN22]